MNPRQQKLEIKDTILKAIERDGQAKWDILMASLCLETGFTEKVISKILGDLIKIGRIEVDDGIITMRDKHD